MYSTVGANPMRLNRSIFVDKDFILDALYSSLLHVSIGLSNINAHFYCMKQQQTYNFT